MNNFFHDCSTFISGCIGNRMDFRTLMVPLNWGCTGFFFNDLKLLLKSYNIDISTLYYR